MLDWKNVAKHWQKEWEKRKIFEANADTNRKKFFATFPYPYLNGYLHVGHTYTLMRVEAFARYKRMQGYNVLFPQGWHATGSPIETAAKRVAEGEQKQIQILKDAGFKDEEINAFKTPEHWIQTFGKAAEQDYKDFGISIDWRRNFVTTDINPKYSKFIQWQFNKLKEGNYVVQGEHPVVWCPKENIPVGDHARAEGEGETPEEMTLLLFKCNDLILPAATFRPETIYGTTNMWLNPQINYVEAEVDGQKWLVSEPTLQKLADQKHKVKKIKNVLGKELVHKTCKNPATGTEIIILPATFVTPDHGTGIVMSVPSHAPYDAMALNDLQKTDEKARGIKPISLIKVEGYGEHPAIEICKKMGISSQTDQKLEEATKEIYKKEFHTGILKANTGKYQGKTVQDAKKDIIKDFVAEKKAATLHDLAGTVICRCLTKCHVKIVDNQWFLAYGSQAWKQKTMKALSELKLYPEKIRPQFEHVIDWLKDWACTRELGLGTKLPWDEKWVIESLSDSTLYPAYYTIAHVIDKIPADKINDKLFDYTFLGKGNIKEIKVDKKLLDTMRAEFLYWYPVDFRNSGKDLVQNHLAFYLFNHTAIFGEEHWPKGIGVNGYVTIGKTKMSKSKGNVKNLRTLVKNFTPDITRITILSSGEELSDVDWDEDFAVTIKNKLEQWYMFACEQYNKEGTPEKAIDKWMESQLNTVIKKTTTAMNETLFRTAIMTGFFDLQRHLRWYLKRRAGTINTKLINQIIDVQTKLLTPFTPHLCEEIWMKLENKGLITQETWPTHEEAKINPIVETEETMIANTIDDIGAVVQLAKIQKAKEVTIIVAQDWKHTLLKKIKEQLKNTRNQGEIIRALMQTELKKYGEKIPTIVQKILKDPSKMPEHTSHQEAELQFLLDSKEFFEQELKCTVHIVTEQESKEVKAGQAMPTRPAIVVR